jgi:hypothetical protein
VGKCRRPTPESTSRRGVSSAPGRARPRS